MRAESVSTPSNAVVPVLKSRQEALTKAREIVPAVAERATRTDADRVVPRETIDEIMDAGLFGLVTPKLFGGSEMGFASVIEVTAELAAACGSTGWVFGVLAGHSWLLNLFPEQAQRDVFANPRALTATVFRLGGTITEVDGGYRLVDGRGQFCSGVDHVDWVIVGNAVQRQGKPPEPRFFVISRADLSIEDDWFTTGMRGTGSRTIHIKEAFIPAHRSVALAEMASGNTPGSKIHGAPLYSLPFQNVVPFSLVGAPLGMAKGALKLFTATLSGKLSAMESEQLAEQSATIARLAEADTDIDAAYALVLEDATRVDNVADVKSLTELEWGRIPRNWAYAAQQSRRAVTQIFEVCGGNAIYEGSEVQRFWRDVNSAAQHFAFGWDAAMTTYGRLALGLPASKFARR